MRMDQLERGGFQNRVPGEGRRCRLGSWMRHSPGSDRDWIWIGVHIRVGQDTRSLMKVFGVGGYGRGKGGRRDATICQCPCHAYRIERLGKHDLGTALSIQSSTYRLVRWRRVSVRFQEVLRNRRLVQTSPGVHWHTGGRPLAREHDFPPPVSIHPTRSASLEFGILRYFIFFAAGGGIATRSSRNGVQILQALDPGRCFRRLDLVLGV